MRHREYSLDYIRVLACLMIVLMHSPMPGLGTSGMVLSGISYLTAPGIGLFFMVSGALLLKVQDGQTFYTRKFLQRRFFKIFVPVVFWTLLGWGLEQLGIKNAESSILWFMYCLAGLYLLTPVLLRWLYSASVREIEFYLLLWLLTLCVPFLKIKMTVNEGDTSWLYYFHGYVGYYVLGHYLQHWSNSDRALIGKYKRFFLSLAVCFSVAIPFLFIQFKVEADFYQIFWYLSITVASQCVVWWMMLKKFAFSLTKQPTFMLQLSKLSFGIYLVHILVMRNVLWQISWMQNMNGIVQIFVCTILTFIISAAVSWCLSKIPYVRAIIGC